MSPQMRFSWQLSIIIITVMALGGFLVPPPPAAADPPDCSGLPSIDGRNLLTKYDGAAFHLQDNATSFGDQKLPSTDDSEGNELDQMFLANDGTKLYIGLTGNTQRTDILRNTVLVFVDTDAEATPTVLNTAGFGGSPSSEALIAMNGVTLDFDADYAIAVWRRVDTGAQYGVLYDLNDPDNIGTPLTLSEHFAVDNSNLLGVNGDVSNDPLGQEEKAPSATTGFEFAIPFSLLGGIDNESTVNIQALIANYSGDISNQSLPVLNPTIGNVGGGEECVGIHTPSHLVDFSTGWASPQYCPFALSPSGTAPGGSLDGAAIPADYAPRPAAAIQNNFTCFGDAAPFSPWPTNGSEIDQIFITNDDGKLYIGVTGNVPYNEGNNNTIIVFIQTGEGLSTNMLVSGDLVDGSGALQGMNGLFFDTDTDPDPDVDTGFKPQWAIEYWRDATTGRHRAVLYDMRWSDPAELTFSMDLDVHTQPNGVRAFSADLSNVLGVNGIAGDDPIRQEVFAATAKAGVLFSIPLIPLGITAEAEIKVAAAVASGSGFISNQWLPPLNPTDPEPQTVSVTFDAPTLPLAIPDDGGETSAADPRTVTMTGIDRITDVNVSVSITHPDMSQLVVTLQHDASGRTVKLWDHAAGSNLNVTFSSEGEPSTVEPAESLLHFNGVDPNGTWTMIVTDLTTGQTGTLNSWGLAVTEYTGGNYNCLGNTTPETPIDLSSEVNFPGNQYFPTTLSPRSPPSSVTAADIPTAFGNSALATQNNFTCFSDAQPPSMQEPIPGSEMDQLFITNTNDRLKLAISGNLERNGNAFVIFFDTVTGGENPLVGNPTPPGSINGLNGMTLDDGFLPDYGLAVSEFSGGYRYRVDLTNLTATTNANRWLGVQDFNSLSGQLLFPGNNDGSELNQLFVQNDADNLYLGMTGNLEGHNDNSFVIFLDTNSSTTGSNPLVTNVSGWPSALRGVNGDILASGFYPDYAIVLWRTDWEFQTAKLCDLVGQGAPVDIRWSFDMVANTFVGNNDNLVGVNDEPADDILDPDPPGGPMQQEINAATATTGMQFAISRASIGSPEDNAEIAVSVVLVGGSGWWSNQALPGFGGGLGNLGGTRPPPVDASAAPAATYLMSSTYTAPTTWDGTAIPTVMADHLLATQDNYTQFGDQAINQAYGNNDCAQVAFYNGNIGGVTGCDCEASQCLGGTVDDAANVDTGMEVDLALADLGLTPQDVQNGMTIRVLALLTGNTGFVSNQTLPGLGWQVCNLGMTPNLANQPGTQYVTYTLVVPNPCGADPADIDGDNDVDAADITAFVGVLMGTNTQTCPLLKSDVNGDTHIDGRDIQWFVNAYLN